MASAFACNDTAALAACLPEPCLNGLVTFGQGEACQFIDELKFNPIEEFTHERLHLPFVAA